MKGADLATAAGKHYFVLGYDKGNLVVADKTNCTKFQITDPELVFWLDLKSAENYAMKDTPKPQGNGIHIEEAATDVEDLPETDSKYSK